MVYLLHFSERYQHAGHYIGYAEDGRVNDRVEKHRAGTGARLTQVATQHGIELVLARVWEGGRKRERQLKNQGGASRRCPVCKERRR